MRTTAIPQQEGTAEPTREGLLTPRARRALAGLAAALVLGIGTVTSLAAWQDQQWIKLPLGTSGFHIEVSLDGGGTWTSATSAGSPGSIALSIPNVTSGLLAPGSTTAGFIQLRVAANSLGATVGLNAPAVGTDSAGLASRLLYGVTSGVQQADCQSLASLASGNNLVSSGTTLASGTSGGSFTLPAPTTSGQPGAAVGVCFRVTLDPALGTVGTSLGSGGLGNVNVNPIWQFSAQSS